METLLLIFPHHLFAEHPGLQRGSQRVALVEDSLYFGDAQYPARFHQQKLWLHRASMQRYAEQLREAGHAVDYWEYSSEGANLPSRLARAVEAMLPRPEKLVAVDPVDYALERRLHEAARKVKLPLELLPSPGFLNHAEDNQRYFEEHRRWFMADFYKWQRRRLKLLVEGDQPIGGQWSFDQQNRKKIPRQQLTRLPKLPPMEVDATDRAAQAYVVDRFGDHPGSLQHLFYPTSHAAAAQRLSEFLEQRLELFGDYEDALEPGEAWLWHSVLTPSLNIGLLTPRQIVDATLAHARQHPVPLNSLEGFIRQIVGWREFMRATYADLGVRMRTSNHWSHHRPLLPCFYDGTTGIAPVDDVIHRLLATGYCHHIERLMVLGGFMFLCEIDPRAIYGWFMEMFIDSYDWVMVPNVFAMSQHADGGLITTKPYFSGSAYIRKMSHYPQGPWCATWDGLYWRWIWKHHAELSKNPRWAAMCSQVKKMGDHTRRRHLDHAEAFLAR